MNDEPSFVKIYWWLSENIEKIGIPTFSASQDVPKKMPVCRVQFLNGSSTDQFKNATEYSYPFQIDVVDAQDKLVRSLTNAYKIMQLCQQISIDGYSVGLVGKPQLSSMVDSSTNQILNRQIIRVTYNVIENTVL
ncbi:MAG TPA: hypothetical protein K8W06_04470 [Limosilactobacillus coleohominis]|nr:hypothetical protein [Limosilactobacillus coleohominis]